MRFIKFLIILAVSLTSCKAIKYADLDDGLYADIQTNKGDILVELYANDMPMTVANFVSLAEGNNPKIKETLNGIPFYDGVKFHRVVKNFMVQTGAPKSDQTIKAGYNFDDEVPLNANGDLLFKHNSAGILSMANRGPKTNNTQFFITHKETPWLDGKHSIFGKVKLGQSIVDTIQQNDYITKVDIIRVGKIAKKFDAPKVFEFETTEEAVVAREAKKKAALEQAKIKFQKEMGMDKAETTSSGSGLKVLRLTEGTGKKVNPALPTTVHYTLYDSYGKKIDSSLDRKKPFTFTLNSDPLIAGWKEGAKLMKEGEKSRLFIPSYLGYGVVGRMPVIKPNTDLIFEIEILKVGK